MSEIELLKINLKDLENAKNNIISAMMNIKDIDGLDEDYTQLDIILQNFEDKRLEIESKIENLEEEAYYKENEEQWKAEQREQEYEYWKDQF